jgi:hypothetical protein
MSENPKNGLRERVENMIIPFIPREHERKEVVDAILQAFIEVLPEDLDLSHQPFDDNKGCDSQYGCGCPVGAWRSIRTEILRRMGEPKP